MTAPWSPKSCPPRKKLYGLSIVLNRFATISYTLTPLALLVWFVVDLFCTTSCKTELKAYRKSAASTRRRKIIKIHKDTRSPSTWQMAIPTATFPDANHQHPLAGTKLYHLVTEAHGCEQLVQSCYLMVKWPGVITHSDHLFETRVVMPLHSVCIDRVVSLCPTCIALW